RSPNTFPSRRFTVKRLEKRVKPFPGFLHRILPPGSPVEVALAPTRWGESNRLHLLGQLGQRLPLDLADALAGQAEAAPDLLEGRRPAGGEAEGERRDLGPALAHFAERVDALAQLAGVGQGGVGPFTAAVGKNVVDGRAGLLLNALGAAV